MTREELDAIRKRDAHDASRMLSGLPPNQEGRDRRALLAEIDRLRPVVKAAVGWSEDRTVREVAERELFDALVAAGELEPGQ